MSMTMESLADMAAAISGDRRWTTVTARAVREDITDPAELAARIAADPPLEGWLIGQSGHYLITGGALPDDRWVEGEWIAQSGRSLQLRDIKDGWALVNIVEGEGEPCLVIERQHLSARGAPGTLRWRVYHRATELHIAPVFSAFLGFGDSLRVEERA